MTADRGEAYPRLARSQLDADGAALFDLIAGGPRLLAPGQFPLVRGDDTLEGPFGLFLFAPRLGTPLQELGLQIRLASSIGDRRREIATYTVAVALESAFERQAHRDLALRAGVLPTELELIERGDDVGDSADRALVQFCRAAATSVAPRDEFEALQVHFPRQEVFEIVCVVQYYRALAAMLELYRIVPPGTADGPEEAVAP